jgi:hypothetical protein
VEAVLNHILEAQVFSPRKMIRTIEPIHGVFTPSYASPYVSPLHAASSL